MLVLLTPVGIFLPHFFGAGGAWGEWSKNEVKDQIGYVPKGMEKSSGKYTAPFPDYDNGNENNTLGRKSVFYLLSGLIGVVIIAVPTWLLYRYYQRNE